MGPWQLALAPQKAAPPVGAWQRDPALQHPPDAFSSSVMLPTLGP